MMTRKLKISAARQGANGIEHVTLGTGVEWDGKNITLELHAIPVGNWSTRPMSSTCATNLEN